MTVSNQEGMALREALEQAQEVQVRLKLDVAMVAAMKAAPRVFLKMIMASIV